MQFYGYIDKNFLQQDSLNHVYLLRFGVLWSFLLMNRMFHQHKFCIDIELYKSDYLSSLL